MQPIPRKLTWTRQIWSLLSQLLAEDENIHSILNSNYKSCNHSHRNKLFYSLLNNTPTYWNNPVPCNNFTIIHTFFQFSFQNIYFYMLLFTAWYISGRNHYLFWVLLLIVCADLCLDLVHDNSIYTGPTWNCDISIFAELLFYMGCILHE